jgi:hypothetical protein
MATSNNKKLYREAMGATPNESYKKGLARKLSMGVPLIASASGVKGGRGANRTFGMLTGVTASKTGVKVDPLGVAMAVVPTGILGKIARKAIPAASRIAGAAVRVSRGNRTAAEALDSLYQSKFQESFAKADIARDLMKPAKVGDDLYTDAAYTDWSGGVDRAGNARTYLRRISDTIRNRGDVVAGRAEAGAAGVRRPYYQMPSQEARNTAFTSGIEGEIALKRARQAAEQAVRVRRLGRSTTAEAAAEIRRRLAELRRTRKAR